VRLFAKARALDLDGLPTLVVTADRASVVRPAHGPALGTSREIGQLQREVTAALALSGLGITFLWQWRHCLFLPFRIELQALEGGPAIIDRPGVAATFAEVQIMPASGAETFTVRAAERLHLH
jgi:hypothetical protein